jgi:hypothetical protein
MDKSRMMRWVEHVAHMGEMRNAYIILVQKCKGKRSLRRHKHRWEDNIKMDLLRHRVGFCKHSNEPSGSIKAWVFVD